jgi:hypothetical protein
MYTNIVTVAAIVFITLFTASVTSFSQKEEINQVILTDFIKQYSDYGQHTDPAYREIYNVLNLFDNKVNTTYSFWSQLGDSGFVADLKGPMDQQVCSAELYIFNPKNSPFVLHIGNKEITGSLDSTFKKIDIPNCAQQVDKISMDIDGSTSTDIESAKWTTIEELKLYTKKIIPPVCPPNTKWDSGQQKCVPINPPPVNNGTDITNSTLTFNVSGSTITINADETSKVIVPQKQSIIPENNDDKNEEDDDKKDKKDKKESDD